jgi:molybdate transport system regulatory protein
VTSDILQVRVLLAAPLNLGPGKIRLLKAIAETGSISGAARQMKISYRRAWLMVDGLNKGFQANLVDATTGGPRGGGARLTELGVTLLQGYLDLVAKAEMAIADDGADLLKRVLAHS